MNEIMKNEELHFGIFRTEDLLSYEDLKRLKLNDMLPNELAEVFGKVLKKYCVVVKEHLFTINENNLYTCLAFHFDNLKVLVTRLLQASYNNLPQPGKDALRGDEKKPKDYLHLMHGLAFLRWHAELKKYLTDDDIQFDTSTAWQLHFKNGYLDLKDLKLKPRTAEQYITRCIDRDYKPSTKKEQNKIHDILKTIYPLKEDREYILSQFGKALSGVSDIDQVNLFLLGDGSTSKSFTMKMVQSAVESYLFELSSNTFEMGNRNVDKILNTFDVNPIIRIAWVNELTDKKIDDALFKTFCEGKVKTTKLYREGNHDVVLSCKLILTSNDMPSIKIDTGTSRRIISYRHTSKFVDNPEDVDPSKHVYLKNKHLLNEIRSNYGLLNAIVDILASFCKEWNDGKVYPMPSSVQDDTELIVTANDHIQDFIDKNLEITNDEKDRIGKNKMRELFLEMYPQKHMTALQLISALKQRSIGYSGKMRADGIQGTYYGVKAKDDIDTSDVSSIDENPRSSALIYDESEDKLKKQLNKALQLLEEKDLHIKQLTEELTNLKQILNAVDKKVVDKNAVDKKVVKKITTKHDDPPPSLPAIKRKIVGKFTQPKNVIDKKISSFEQLLSGDF